MIATARKELAVLWLSPLPYVVGVLFHVVLAVLFINQLEGRGQALLQPLFPIAGFLLVAMVPVLTMRSFADEARTGALDVLLAVPVRASALVVGKWFACWITVVVIAAPAAAFVGLLALWADPDPGPAIAGFLGLALMAAGLSALGVLASSLSSSQAVAAMVAFFVALLLWFSHVGTEALSAGSVMSRLSLSERLRPFAAGVIDSADAGFFVILVAVPLAIAGLVIDGRRLR